MVYEILRSRPGRRRDEDDISDVVDEDGNIVAVTSEELTTEGYNGYWDVPSPHQNKRQKSQRIGESAMKGFICGDCGKILLPGQSCRHMRIGQRGKKRASDDRYY